MVFICCHYCCKAKLSSYQKSKPEAIIKAKTIRERITNDETVESVPMSHYTAQVKHGTEEIFKELRRDEDEFLSFTER